MQLAADTTITVAHEVIRLRPTLRAAIILERRFGGLDKIINAIEAGNLSVMSTVIRESSAERTDLADLLDCGGSLSIKMAVEHLHAPLIRHVFALAGVDPDAPAETSTGEKIPFSEMYARLFRIATGWLGWTPEQAYSATLAEIIEAKQGLNEKLKAIYGSGEKEDAIDITDPDMRQKLNALGDMSNHEA